MNVKAMIVHIVVIVLGILAYVFVDVKSPSAFISLLLPSYLVFVVIYIISLLIFYIHKARSPGAHEKHADMMTEAVQVLGEKSNVDVEAIMQRTAVTDSAVDAGVATAIATTTVDAVIEPSYADVLIMETTIDTSQDEASDIPLDQDDINQMAWEDEQNWTGPDWLAIYFSKQDSRNWVPKKIPALGWTVNLGQRAGWGWWLVVWLLSVIVVANVIVFSAR